ncbi:MAG: PAS domain S-box protein [Acetobacteraceae bacterium]|nr:PAS domain S-box protein [Pseudomonadota bacterium]
MAERQPADSPAPPDREAALEAEIARLRALLARAGLDADQATGAIEPPGVAALDREVHVLNKELEATHAALNESEARLRNALAIETVGVMFWGPDFTLTDVNAAFLKMTGFSREEALGLSWDQLTPEDFHDVSRASIAKLHERGEITPYEKQTYRKDGSRWWGLFAARKIDTEAVEFVLDITARREMEAALRESEQRLRLIVENAHDYAIFVTDADDRITDWQTGAAAVFGWSAAEAIGQPGRILYVPEDRAQDVPEKELQTARIQGIAPNVRWHQRRDGTRVFIEGSVTALRGADGSVSGFLKIGQDVTDRRAAEERLRKSEAELRRLNETLEAEVEVRTTELRQAIGALHAEALERLQAEEALRQAQKMEAIGQLTGGVAHDFNNMLQAISGSLELMQKRVSQDRASEIGRFIGAARQTLERAAALTHRLLAFARRQALQAEPVNPDALVEGLADLLRRTMGPAIKVDLRLGDGSWRVQCDPNQLESGILNLAINARDAMPEGGRLTVSTRHASLSARDLAHEDSAQPGDFVEVAVTDTGSGMDAVTRSHAFEPFFTTKPIGQGTGLGLSQVYGFARQSNGTVRIDSAVGSGTTVRLYLPRHAQAAEDLATPAPAPAAMVAGSGRGVAILLVEDEAAVRALAGEHLRDLGYHVLEAADGPSALRLLRDRRYQQVDLLVTDVGLPNGLNGRQLAEAARDARPGLPVLLITGYAGSALEDELSPGITVITKPFALDALARRVREMINEPR